MLHNNMEYYYDDEDAAILAQEENDSFNVVAEQLLGEVRFAQSAAKNANKTMSFTVSKEKTDEFRGNGSISAIANIIKEIGDKVPLVRREDGSPDAARTVRSIKATDQQLYNKLIIYSLLGRSTWGTALTKCAPLASFTPIVLAAYKPVCKFSAWDTKANWDQPIAMYVCMGTTLANIIVARPKDSNIFKPEFIKELAQNGTKFTKFKITEATLKPIYNNDNKEKAAFTPLKQYAYMLSSTWIAHPSVRNSDTMILDIYDWDKVPESAEQEEVLDVEEAYHNPDDL